MQQSIEQNNNERMNPGLAYHPAFDVDLTINNQIASQVASQVSRQVTGQQVPDKSVKMGIEPHVRLRGAEQGVAALAHDARNMLTALGLYCDLLEEPGVLGLAYRHYSSELRMVAAASSRLVDQLVALDTEGDTHQNTTLNQLLAPVFPPTGTKALASTSSDSSAQQIPQNTTHSPLNPGIDRGREISRTISRTEKIQRWGYSPAEPITNLALELQANRNLLAALAGPLINLQLYTTGGELPVRLTTEDLTRILVNLVKNAAEALPRGGQINVTLSENGASVPDSQNKKTVPSTPTLLLSISDNGPGISEDLLEDVFATGFTTRTETDMDASWPGQHYGLGLSICRSIVEAAGGSIRAHRNPEAGTRIEIELTANTYSWAPVPEMIKPLIPNKTADDHIDEWLQSAD